MRGHLKEKSLSQIYAPTSSKYFREKLTLVFLIKEENEKENTFCSRDVGIICTIAYFIQISALRVGQGEGSFIFLYITFSGILNTLQKSMNPERILRNMNSQRWISKLFSFYEFRDNLLTKYCSVGICQKETRYNKAGIWPLKPEECKIKTIGWPLKNNFIQWFLLIRDN